MYYDPKWRSRYFRIIEKITFHIIAETITHFYRMRHRIIPYFHTGRTIDYFRFCRYDISLFVYKFKSPQLLIFRDQSITAMFKSDFYYILFQLMAFIQRACIQKTFFAISLGQSPVSKALTEFNLVGRMNEFFTSCLRRCKHTNYRNFLH